jgi:acetyltransferase-like isoleucine patch superfamily enzyme
MEIKYRTTPRACVVHKTAHVKGSLLSDCVEIGHFCVITGARIGTLTKIQSYVELRKGTVIGEDCYIDSGVKMSGNCVLGNNVTVRYDAIIARGCEIGDGSYVSPQVMFVNVSAKGAEVGGAKVGKNVFIGTNATIGHGVTICDNAIIGAKALVVKDIDEPGTYVGIPARRIK